MSDPVIREQLVDYLYRGPVTVPSDSALRDEVGFNDCSKNQVNKAMGRLITNGEVVRCRPEPQHMGDEERPITYILRRS